MTLSNLPFTPLGQRGHSVTGRLNIGYVHSNLDGPGLEVGVRIGFFGPVEVSFDLRIRRLGAPTALQLTAGYRIATGGGPTFALGLVTPTIGGASARARSAE